MQMDELMEIQNGQSAQIKEMDVCSANMSIGKAFVKVAYRQV